MAMATRELETLSETADLADTVRLLRRLVEVAPTLERALVGFERRDVPRRRRGAPRLRRDGGVDRPPRRARAQGLLPLSAGAAVGVADRVVTSFDESDVEQLGDNVVAMLEALRDVTQPEMLAFLTRMIDAVQAEQQAVEMEPAEPPACGRSPARSGTPTSVEAWRGRCTRSGPSRPRPGPTPPVGSSRSNPTHPTTRRREHVSTATIAGQSVSVNDEGFMTEYDEWNEDLGRELASMIGIDEMTDDHWAAIRFLRSDFAEQGETADAASRHQGRGDPDEAAVRPVPEEAGQEDGLHRRSPEAQGLRLSTTRHETRRTHDRHQDHDRNHHLRRPGFR